MRLRGVDIPQPLIEAQKIGSMVVFAGAGVSMPAPSSYPSFKGLADQIAGGVAQGASDRDFDQFLGKLVDQGIAVHKRAVEILSNSNSAPNHLHRDLLRLFEGASKVRLVTTNFDRHFTTAAKNVFTGQETEIYAAPALPLGNSFYGLVYLHGSVDKDSNRMALTDRDFGRAYLTDGWATRFLERLFTEYTVVFVGYGHNDVVINYLARGLPPPSETGRRFAFVPVGEEDRWRSLGVVSIPYPTNQGQEEHAALAQTLAAWADLSRCGMLDHEQKLKAIVENPVPLAGDDLDYVASALRDVSTAQFFTRHARSTDWLRWIENQEPFTRLFGTRSSVEAVDWQLASWFADNFAAKYPAEALAAARRGSEHLGPALSISIATSFFRSRPSPSVLGQWIPILIKHFPREYRHDFFHHILYSSRCPEDSAVALLLFEQLTIPEIKLTQGFLIRSSADEDEVDFEIAANGGGYWLDQAWEKVLKPNLDHLADGLLWIVTSHLEKASRLLDSCGKVHDGWDTISSSRDSIRSGEGVHSNAINVLIDAARDIILWYVANRPSRADAIIQLWFSSRCRILRRIAAFAISESPNWTAESKVAWVIENQALRARDLRKEVFSIVEKTYATVSEASRIVILDEVSKSLQLADIEDWQTREIYHTIFTLSEIAPHCSQTRARLEEIIARHPELGPHDRTAEPKGKNPPEAAELISKPATEWLEIIASYQPQSPFGPNRGDLLRNISQAVTEDFNWGMGLARAVASAQDWNSDLWKPVVGAWGRRTLSEEEWKHVLAFLIENDGILPVVVYECSQFLENGSKGTGVPTCVRHLALDLSERLWPICRDVLVGSGDNDKEWVFTAINNPAGWLTEFWLRTLMSERQEAQESGIGAGIPDPYKKVFVLILRDDSYAAGISGVLLASHFHILFSFDESWSIQHLVPLLMEWERHQKCLQAWHGYLWWGRWMENSLPHLLPCYEGAVPFIHELGKARQSFSNHLAGIATFSSLNPIEHGWLYRFLRLVPAEDRTAWAEGVRSGLQKMKDLAVTTLWHKWLRNYWQDRIQGVPVPLSANESAAMAHWTPYLGPVFPEAVVKVCSSPTPDMEREFVYSELASTQLPELHPGPLGALLAFLLSAQKILYDMGTIASIVRRASAHTTDKSNLVKVCEQLARLGYPNAGKLL